jgi:hypothetical protein
VANGVNAVAAAPASMARRERLIMDSSLVWSQARHRIRRGLFCG